MVKSLKIIPQLSQMGKSLNYGHKDNVTFLHFNIHIYGIAQSQ